MRVDEARHHRAATQVDDLRRRSGLRRDRRVIADRGNPAATDRDGLGCAELRIDRENPAIAEDEIGRLGKGRRRRSQRDEAREP
jgi:hypothetical protein